MQTEDFREQKEKNYEDFKNEVAKDGKGMKVIFNKREADTYA